MEDGAGSGAGSARAGAGHGRQRGGSPARHRGQVKNSSLTGKDIKNKSLSTKDFSGSLRGPGGALDLGGVADSLTVPAGEVLGGTMPCPDGTQIVSGGYEFEGVDGEVFVDVPAPSGDGWTVIYDNTGSTEEATLTVVAWCTGGTGKMERSAGKLERTPHVERLIAARMKRAG